MTQTGDLQTPNAAYRMIQGYILVKPLAEQFKAKHPDAKLKQFSNWKVNKQIQSRLLEIVTDQ